MRMLDNMTTHNMFNAWEQQLGILFQNITPFRKNIFMYLQKKTSQTNNCECYKTFQSLIEISELVWFYSFVVSVETFRCLDVCLAIKNKNDVLQEMNKSIHTVLHEKNILLLIEDVVLSYSVICVNLLYVWDHQPMLLWPFDRIWLSNHENGTDRIIDNRIIE